MYINYNDFVKIISTDFSSIEIIHKYNERHVLCKCKISDFLNSSFLSSKVENWEYNRPPDMVRCIEIANFIYSTKNEIDWLFYLVYDDTSKSYKVVDGIHRYTALQYIKKENEKDPDYITPNSYGSKADAEWLYDKYIIVSLRFNATNGEIIDLFQSLNKSNPVPELYMDNNTIKREIIEEIVKEWQENYSSHFSPKVKPNTPNINREQFISLLDFLYDKYKIRRSTGNLLSERLYEANNKVRNNIPKKISLKVLEKCRETNCYLFLLKRDVLENII
jgi:hypothetical protein